MANNAGHVMNLANSIIGVGLLAMPFCFKQCGITLAIAMLILSSVMSKLACHFLVKSSAMCRRRNFEFLAFYAFGPSGKLLVELGIIGFMMGTCVAFFVVMGDLGPAIISKILNINNNNTLRTTVLIAIGVLVILPLGLLKNVESLVAISTATIGFYFLFMIKIFFESSLHLIAGDWWYNVNFWRPEGVLQCIPIFAMALSCQTQLFEIYESLSSPTAEKINSVVHSAINLCTVVYAIVGFLGYVAYCKGTFTGNILLSFTPSLSSEMFKLGFVMSIAVSFPLVIFPCRASLHSLIFKRVPIHHEAGQISSHIPDSRFKWLTIAIVTVSLTTGLLIPSIELVLGFVGSTIGIAICIIFPSLSFLNLTNKNTNDKMLAKITVIVGVLIMILGTFGNLFAAVENKSTELQSKQFLNFRGMGELKTRPKKQVFIESSKKDIVAVPLVNSISPVENLNKMEPPETSVVGNKLEENQRKEPPVPVAPALESKVNRKFAVPEIPQIEINKKKWMSKSKKINNVPELKLNQIISKDAIEKEEREIMEIERHKKAEHDQREGELLKMLKEHQDEQKKLLKEQEKLLIEMKNREIKNEKKLNEILKEKSMSNVAESEVKAIKRETFRNDLLPSRDMKGNLDEKFNFNFSLGLNSNQTKEKQREMVPDRGTNFHPAPDNSSFSNDGKKRAKDRLLNDSFNAAGNVKQKDMSDPGKSVPEISYIEKKHLKSNFKVRGRDILNEKNSSRNVTREKREADVSGSNVVAEEKVESGGEKCSKEEETARTGTRAEKAGASDPGSSKKIAENFSATADQKLSDLIKNSIHLSLDVAEEKESDASKGEGAELIDSVLSQSIIGKKRDLKSLAPFDN